MEQRAARWDQSRSDAIRDGKGTSRPPSLGYRYADPARRESGRGRVNSRFVAYDPERPIVIDLFERKAAGASWLELARWLDEAAPKPNGRRWSRNTVRSMVESRTYLGERGSGEHVNPNAHEGIVTPALWRRAQGKPGRRTPRGTYLLSGLVRCSGCGYRMRATSGGKGSKPPVYTCICADCELRYTTVTVKRLDEEVVQQFFAHLDAFHLAVVDDGDVKTANDAVAALTRDVESLAMVVPTHPTAVAAHQSRLSEVERALAEAEDHRDALVATRSKDGPDVRELRADWPTLTLAERREILSAGIGTVLVRRSASRAMKPPVAERIRVVFAGDAPPGLVDNGRSGAIKSWSWDDAPGSLVAAA